MSDKNTKRKQQKLILERACELEQTLPPLEISPKQRAAGWKYSTYFTVGLMTLTEALEGCMCEGIPVPENVLSAYIKMKEDYQQNRIDDLAAPLGMTMSLKSKRNWAKINDHDILNIVDLVEILRNQGYEAKDSAYAENNAFHEAAKRSGWLDPDDPELDAKEHQVSAEGSFTPKQVQNIYYSPELRILRRT